MADPNTIQADVSGTDPISGAPQAWRRVLARHPRNICDIVNDPTRGAWNSTHNGITFQGTYDAFEQQAAINGIKFLAAPGGATAPHISYLGEIAGYSNLVADAVGWLNHIDTLTPARASTPAQV